MRTTIAIASAAAVLAAPAAAAAHVTLQPDRAPAGGFARLDVRVPNERDNASTTKVEVKFPAGFSEVSTEPVAGWTTKVATSRLAEPITTDEGDKVTDQVDTITWTGDGDRRKIGPGQFEDFGLSLALPDKPGASLTFKSLQTYSNGEVVRWIGPPGSEEPAPQVKLTGAPAAHNVDQTQPSSGGDDDSGAPTWLAVLALVVGTLGLLAGVGGLAAARRRPA